MRRLLVCLQILAGIAPTFAQQHRPATSASIYRDIAQLGNLTRVLYLAAHPDDENTRLLAWLVNDQHVQTAYLSLTRGDGGQNILGSEQGAALGLIRTYELLEARKLDGAGQFFSRAIDFGFSKTYNETFLHWDRRILLQDVVKVIRQYKPDIVICRFPPNEQAGHGQHAASAIMGAEAFQKSGDSTYELADTKPWKPKRILWNTYRFGDRNTTSEDQFKMRVGNYSAPLGMGYGELAGISRSIHRSQGAGTPSVAGVQTEYFSLVAGDSLKQDLFEGLDISWRRVGRPEIGETIKSILEDFDYNAPQLSLPALLELREEINTVRNKYWREEKLRALDAVLASAAGWMMEVTTNVPEVAAGDSVSMTARFIARSGKTPITIKEIAWRPQVVSTLNWKLKSDSLYSLQQSTKLDAELPVTEPYWLQQKSESGFYAVPEHLLGLPTTPNALVATCKLAIGDADLSIPVPISFKKLDPLKGDVVEALRIVPPLSIDWSAPLQVTETDGSLRLQVHLRTFKPIQNGTLTIFNQVFKKEIHGINLRAGIDTLIPATLSDREVKQAGNDEFSLSVGLKPEGDAGAAWNRAMHLIRYDHLPTLQYFTPAETRVLRRSWKVSVKKIGYLEGAGDKTADVLRQCGLDVTTIKESELSDVALLQHYDAIVTGIRAANTRKEMKYWMPVLLAYVQQGGTLVLQYNTLQDMATKDLGPFPFTLANLRVTEEDAPVTILNPDHPLLQRPNPIQAADFAGWVQERGLYFAKDWDSQYTPLLQMNDAGEDPLRGALLHMPYGKGQYIYTSLSFFRQLPAGNKGAIRLFMNLLSAGR